MKMTCKRLQIGFLLVHHKTCRIYEYCLWLGIYCILALFEVQAQPQSHYHGSIKAEVGGRFLGGAPQTQSNHWMQGQDDWSFSPSRLTFEMGRHWGKSIDQHAKHTYQTWMLQLGGVLQYKSIDPSYQWLKPGVRDQEKRLLNQLNIHYRYAWNTDWQLECVVGYFVPLQSWYATGADIAQVYKLQPQWSQTRSYLDRRSLGVAVHLFHVDTGQMSPHLTLYQSQHQSQWQAKRRLGQSIQLQAFRPADQDMIPSEQNLAIGLEYQMNFTRLWFAMKSFYYQTLNPAISNLSQPNLDDRLSDEYQTLSFFQYLPTVDLSFLGEVLMIQGKSPVSYSWTLGWRSIADADFTSSLYQPLQAQQLAEASLAQSMSLGEHLYIQQQLRWALLPQVQWLMAYQWYDLHLDFAYDTLHQVDVSLHSVWTAGLSTQLLYRHTWSEQSNRWSQNQDEIFLQVTWDTTWIW